MMQHFQSLSDIQLPGAWLTIGSFDGVHRGHHAILKRLVSGAHADGLPAVVVTFFPHPAQVLRGRNGPFYLTTPEERALLLGQAGVDYVLTLPFTREMAGLSARQFVQQMHASLAIRRLFIGHDFALGRGREGDLPVLRSLGKEFGFRVSLIHPVLQAGQPVSSSRVRLALNEGDVRTARLLCGRPYRLEGTVVDGDRRGRSIGIPTANLDIWPARLLPKTGVYACLAQAGGQVRKAVVNIGVRPTFEPGIVQSRVEAHLLDFNQDLYQQPLALSFFAHLRDEQRFASVPDLVEQIQRDIRQARRLLRLPRQP
jgi:riboflavin kinase / FMN adenylyltransferase